MLQEMGRTRLCPPHRAMGCVLRGVPAPPHSIHQGWLHAFRSCFPLAGVRAECDAQGPHPPVVPLFPLQPPPQNPTGEPVTLLWFCLAKSHPSMELIQFRASHPQIFISPPITFTFPILSCPRAFLHLPALSFPCPGWSLLSCSTLQWRGGGGGWVLLH